MVGLDDGVGTGRERSMRTLPEKPILVLEVGGGRGSKNRAFAGHINLKLDSQP